MDDPLRQQIAAWLEYYRDLGIEEFYHRAPAEHVEMRHSKTANRPGTEPAAVPSTISGSPDSRTPAISPPLSLSLFEGPEPVRGPETLEQIRADLGDCQRCKLAGGRKTIVFGQGDPHAALVFVGEGPGADEDEQGLPFVGRAGQLLNRMIQFVGMKREEVYICNIVKCRPPGNRTPEKDEVDACSPFLFRQLQAIQPRLICCLGAPAMKTLLGIKEGITRVRGQFFDYAGTKAFVAYHPAYILRNPREEKILREDFEKIRDFLKRPR
jgi:uracil-DNA glycosylase family 4